MATIGNVDQSVGTLVHSAMGLVEMEPRKPAPKPQKVSAQVLQRRRRLKEMLVGKLAKQFNANGDPYIRSVISSEADAALAKGELSASDIKALEGNIQKTLNVIRGGSLDPPRSKLDTGKVGSERVDWGLLYDFKKIQGDNWERQKLAREQEARDLLLRQLKHQIRAKEAQQRNDDRAEEAYARHVAEEHRKKVAQDQAAKDAYAARLRHHRDLNLEHVRHVERKRAEEAQLRQLEDERMLAEIRSAEEKAKRDKARKAVERAKHLEMAQLANERSRRIKQEAKDREEAEQKRLDAVWTEMLDEQERKREEGLKLTIARQHAFQDAYGKTAGAEMAERARKDETNMLMWQKKYAEEQEERERREKQKFDDTQKDILQSLTQQMRIAEDRRREEIEADRRQAEADAENDRVAKEVERRLREEARRKAIEYQGELAHHARLVKESQRAGMLNENYMSEGDKMYNSHLVRAVLEYHRTGKLVEDADNIVAPMG